MISSREQSIRDFLARFKIEVRDLDLFHQALTHRSYAYENPGELDNERLEFLGDAVLGILVCEHLYHKHPDHSEGELSRIKSSLVNRSILGKIAREMRLGDVILLGKGEAQTGGRTRLSVLGSGLEALIGAVYVSLGMSATSEFVLQHVIAPAQALLESKRISPGDEELIDYKSQLQERVQKDFQAVPDYRTIHESGPDHNKSFLVEVLIQGKVCGRGYGRRKKSAENRAAKEALAYLSSLKTGLDSLSPQTHANGRIEGNLDSA
jgi:ribonuclease-3